jgi:hypothetical protein
LKGELTFGGSPVKKPITEYSDFVAGEDIAQKATRKQRPPLAESD